MKKIFWIAVYILMGTRILAQTDSIYRAYQRGFEDYKRTHEADFKAFQEKNDSSFLQFLEKRWKDFEVFRTTQTVRPKPKYQPVMTGIKDTISRQVEFIAPVKMDSIEKKGKIYNFSNMEIEKPVSSFTSGSFDYLGTQIGLFIPPDNLPILEGLNENAIKVFYKKLSQNNALWAYNLSLFQMITNKYKLNDWGYYLILKSASEKLFSNKNEQTLFIWYCMIKSGYYVKVGHDLKRVYLMPHSLDRLSNCLYTIEKGKLFYLFDSEHETTVKLRTQEDFIYKDAKAFSFRLNEIPTLTFGKKEIRQMEYLSQKTNFEFNDALLTFFNTYPTCSLEIYFRASLTNQSIKAFGKLLTPLLIGKKDIEKVDILLSFIQNNLPYKSDFDQFGKERYFFAEECMYYLNSDCEDRAILFTQLIKHYTGLEAIGLDFPQHVAAAVHLSDEAQGAYILFEGKKYFVCDPTFIGSKIGMLSPELKGIKPKIILQ